MGRGEGETDSLLPKDSKNDRGCLLSCDKQGALEVDRDEQACATCGKGCKHFCYNLHWWLLACLLNLIFSPILLTYYALKLYVFPCIEMYFDKGFLSCFEKICCESCFRFTDSEFPPNSSSLGDVSAGFAKGSPPPEPGCCEARQYLETGGDVEWIRGKKFLEEHVKEGEEVKLFSGGVEPADVAQGALGNCWLLAALATLADHKGAIESAFITKQMNPRGRYQVQLYDPANDGFEAIAVDDYIPCTKNTGKPAFSQPNGEELWVLILEKCFAKSKYFGTYHATEGGLPCYALYLLTGGKCTHWSSSGGEGWGGNTVCHKDEEKDGAKKYSLTLKFDDLKKPDDDMFEFVKAGVPKGWVMAAGSQGKDNTIEEGRGADGGIVPGHAYSILDCVHVDDIRLIRLRNPWGTFEWDKAWSNNSPTWDEHPKVKKQVAADLKDRGRSVIEPGAFWMSWEDFLVHFSIIDVCQREQTMDHIALDANEDMGWCGPCTGCCVGCLDFYLLCNGPAMLYCNRLVEMDDREGSWQNTSFKSCCCCCGASRPEAADAKKELGASSGGK